MTQVTDGSVSPAPHNPFKTPVTPAAVQLPRADVLGSIGPATTVVVTPRTPTNLSRQQILDATDVCLQELGYDGTTIRRIAKELGCAVGSIYRYFDDKRALLTAVVQRRFEPVTERITQGAPIDAVANLYSQIAAEQPELYRLMFWLSSIGKKTHTNTLPQIIREVVDGWAEQLGDRRAAEGYWSQLHGSIMHGRRADDLPLPTAAAPAQD